MEIMHFSPIVLQSDGSRLLREQRIWVKYTGLPLTKPSRHLQEKCSPLHLRSKLGIMIKDRGNPGLLAVLDFGLLEQYRGETVETFTGSDLKSKCTYPHLLLVGRNGAD